MLSRPAGRRPVRTPHALADDSVALGGTPEYCRAVVVKTAARQKPQKRPAPSRQRVPASAKKANVPGSTPRAVPAPPPQRYPDNTRVMVYWDGEMKYFPARVVSAELQEDRRWMYDLLYVDNDEASECLDSRPGAPAHYVVLYPGGVWAGDLCHVCGEKVVGPHYYASAAARLSAIASGSFEIR